MKRELFPSCRSLLVVAALFYVAGFTRVSWAGMDDTCAALDETSVPSQALDVSLMEERLSSDDLMSPLEGQALLGQLKAEMAAPPTCSDCDLMYLACLNVGMPSSTCWNEYQECLETCN